MQKIKNNWKLIIGIVIGFVIPIIIVFATDTIYFASNDVNYSNTSSGLEATTLEDALDELYTKYSNLWCHSGYVKQNETSDSYVCGPPPPICTRVTSPSDLHTETCSQSSNYCYADGYYSGGSKNTTTITYGSIWDGSSALKAGDAFDCDINNNGVIDKVNGVSTERFYYVSDRWNEGTDINSFDSNTAVLIYYKNYVSGAASDSSGAYDSVNIYNWHGPVTAVTHLPKTTGTNAWRADLLTTRSRTIYVCNDTDCSTTPTLTTSGGTITPNPFDYGSTTAARLLALPEVIKGCKAINGNTSLTTPGALSACNFLFEETKYSSSSKGTNGPWFETPQASSAYGVWYANGIGRRVGNNNASNTTLGVRPAIEVLKSKISQ